MKRIDYERKIVEEERALIKRDKEINQYIIDGLNDPTYSLFVDAFIEMSEESFDEFTYHFKKRSNLSIVILRREMIVVLKKEAERMVE